MLFIYHVKIFLNRLTIGEARMLAKLKQIQSDLSMVHAATLRSVLESSPRLYNATTSIDSILLSMLDSLPSLQFVTVCEIEDANNNRCLFGDVKNFVFEYQILNATIDFSMYNELSGYLQERGLIKPTNEFVDVQFAHIKPKEFFDVLTVDYDLNTDEFGFKEIFNSKLLFENPICTFVWPEY